MRAVMEIKGLAAYKLAAVLRDALKSDHREDLEVATLITIGYLEDIVEAWRLLNVNIEEIRSDIDEDITRYLKRDGAIT